ncbi:MAG: alpha-2-macroglobulin family protein [Sulfurovum sp.]
MNGFKLLVILCFSFFGFSQSVADEAMVNVALVTDSGVELSSTVAIFDTSVKYTHKKVVKCIPKIDATYKIISAKKMVIIPTKALSSGKAYSCKYKDRGTFLFNTDAFGLNYYSYFNKEKLLRLEFNDDIDTKSIKNNIFLYKKKALSKTALLYDISSRDSRVLVLKIKEIIDGDLELSIKGGLSTVDNKKLNSDIVKEIGKEVKDPVTLNPKKAEMIFTDLPQMVAKDDGSFAIRVFFNDSFYGKPFKRFISVDGIDNLSIKEDIYLSYQTRREYKLKSSYYYMDIMSKDFKPNSDYTLRLDKGLAHYKELKEDKVFKLHSGDRKRVIFFNDKEPYVSNLGEIGFASINVDKATVIIDKITPDNYRYFVGYNSAKQSDTSKFTQEVFAKDVVLDNPRNVVQKQKILIKDMVGDIPNGVYKITIKYEDRVSKDKVVDKSASKVIFVSDIGMLVNLSSNQAFISLAKLSNTAPIVNAKVDIYSKNNILLSSTLSDENGIAIIDKDGLIDKEPKAIIVSTTNDKSFLLLDKSLNSMSYDKLKQKEDRYSAFIYFQSNIIRPASSINSLITIKDRDFVSASKLPIKITLSEQYGKKIFEKVYTTDEFGLIDFTYTMSNDDKTGRYRLEARLGDKVIGKKSISVEAFMPPKIENKIKTDKSEYSSDEFINASISSNYLFGMPSSFLDGKVSFNIRGVNYSNSKYKGFSFTNDIKNGSEKVYINSEYDISLDEKGETTIVLPCATTKQVPSILKGTIGATIMDDTQPVSTYKNITIYPYKNLVGVKLDNSSLEEGKPLEGSVVLIDPVSGLEVDRELSVVIQKVNWHYTYSSGHYKWEKETNPIDTFMIKSNQKFSRDLTQSGDFLIEVNDRLYKHSTMVSFEVNGWDYTNITPDSNLKKIDIKFEDRLYKKGDILKASIKSPIIRGRVLVSLEGTKVQWHKIINIDKGIAQIEVPIEDEIGRGVYLHAVAVRDTDISPSIIPFRVMGYKFIKPDRTKHLIDIKMEYNTTTISNSSVDIKIKTDKETALLVSVVDSGILNITEQKAPKIFDFFNPMIDKKTLYFDIYDEVMAYLTEGNVISFGAGDEMMASKMRKHLPPANLDRVKPFMLWSNIVYTKNGKANITLDIPEFNGKATIVVVAINKDSIGVKSSDLIIKDDIMIKPSYPRFILKGDKIEVPIRVFNTTDKTQKITINATVSYNLSLELPNPTIELAPNSSKVIYANLIAKEEGKSSIKLSTKLNGSNFSNSLSLLVMTPYSLQTKVYQDTISSPAKIIIPDRFNHGKMIISLSDNILGQLRGDLKYLISYPYGCAEQTSSKISAMFYSKPFLKNDKLTLDADNFIRQGIKKLSRMQNYYGEFSYWEQGGYVNAYASLYASEILLALDKAGYFVEDNIKKKIIKALQKIAKGDRLSTKISNVNRLYAGYILSLYNELSTTTANLLYDKKIYKGYYISWYYMSAIFKSIGYEELSKDIYRGVSNIKLDELKNVNYKHTGFSSESRDMFLIFYLNTKHFYSSKNDFETVKRQFTKLYSTHDKAMALRAISEYLGEAINDKMSVELLHNNTKTTYVESVVFTDDIWDNDIYIKPLSGVVNYSVEVYKPLPRVIKNELLDYEALSISREFIDINGDRVDLQNLQQGAKIYSEVTILNNEKIANVVLNQRIPACMDIVNSRVSKSKNRSFNDKNLKLNHKDIRDDRVLFFIELQKPKRASKIKNFTKPNITTIYTPLIVTTVGECHLPAVTIEAMYDSRLNDYAKESETIVVKSKKDIDTINLAQKPIKITSKYLKDKVREYYMLEASSLNPDDFVEYFHYPITRYFNERGVSREYMLDDKAEYNREWRYKKYDIKDIKIINKNIQAKIYRVKITFGYKLKNSKGKSIKGVSTHLVTFREIKGKLLIDKIEIF